MSKYGFPPEARILTGPEFRKVYRQGRRLYRPPLRLVALRREDGGSRLGLSVGRKSGNAVVRNRWKRAIREAFRLHRHDLAADWDLVISVDWEAPVQKAARVDDAFQKAVRDLNAATQVAREEAGQ